MCLYANVPMTCGMVAQYTYSAANWHISIYISVYDLLGNDVDWDEKWDEKWDETK